MVNLQSLKDEILEALRKVEKESGAKIKVLFTDDEKEVPGEVTIIIETGEIKKLNPKDEIKKEKRFFPCKKCGSPAKRMFGIDFVNSGELSGIEMFNFFLCDECSLSFGKHTTSFLAEKKTKYYDGKGICVSCGGLVDRSGAAICDACEEDD